MPSPNIRVLQIDMHCLYQASHVAVSDFFLAFISLRTEQLYVSLPEGPEMPVISSKMNAIAILEALRPFTQTIKHRNLPALSSQALRTQFPDFQRLWPDTETYCQLRLKHPTSRPYPKCLSTYIWGDQVTSAGLPTDASVMFRRGSWGRTVRHIEISNVDISALTIDRIRAVDNSFADLKALVIIPSAPAPRPACFLKAPGDTHEGKLARRLLLQRLPSLRVVVIGGHRFWLESSDREPNGPRRFWYLRDAMDDPIQAQEMERVLDKVDWWFLVPPYGTRLDDAVGGMSIKRM